MSPLCWPHGIFGVRSQDWVGIRDGTEGPRGQGTPPHSCISPIPKKGPTGQFLGGRVRACRLTVRC